MERKDWEECGTCSAKRGPWKEASLLPLICYYFEAIWGHLKAARRLAISANQKRVLITRDIPTLTKPSPPTHQLGFQSPPLRQILTSIGVKGIRLSMRRAIARFVYHNAIPTAENFSRLGVHKPKVISGPPQPILLIYQNFQSRVGTNLVPVLSAVSSVQRSGKPLLSDLEMSFRNPCQSQPSGETALCELPPTLAEEPYLDNRQYLL